MKSRIKPFPRRTDIVTMLWSWRLRVESFHTASPNRMSSLISANFGANSPRVTRPAVCLILCCAIMCWVFSAAADIMRVNEIFVSVTMPYC